MPSATINAIASYLPDRRLTNEDLAAEFPDWEVDKIFKKTGIESRAIAAADETAGDMAFKAATKLFETNSIQRGDIDFLMLCTQSPDYFLPTTACVLQHRLELPTSCGALDFNLGCSGFIYGLSLAKGLISSKQAKNVLLITAETYSKYLNSEDRSVRTIFGDGAAATLISASEDGAGIGGIVLGTDGSGAENLIVREGAAKGTLGKTPELKMAGPEILNFTLEAIPGCINGLLEQEHLNLDDIDHFVFHQANAFILTQLRRKLKIPKEKFCINMNDYANTVSATIPMALEKLTDQKSLNPGDKILLCGFGVGYSWGACIIDWT